MMYALYEQHQQHSMMQYALQATCVVAALHHSQQHIMPQQRISSAS
jgi:hypothetical protein